ncbi:MAG: hypothetical protein KIC82_01030 [Acholeplasma sp.]|nr:hypothetical protein [Acholeplasma sp.]
MSPIGVFNDVANVCYVTADGSLSRDNVDYNNDVRPVLNLSADTLASGSGTSSDPYIVK